MKKKLIPLWTSLLVCAPIADAFAASVLEFRFSGVFGACEGACDTSPLQDLANTGFAGRFQLPVAAPTRMPDTEHRPFDDDLLVSGYAFGTGEATLTLETAGSLFDRNRVSPVTVAVGTCAADGCPRNRNFVWILHEPPGEFGFNLVFGGAESGSHGPGIPEVDGYARFLFTGFEIHAEDFSAGLRPATLDSGALDFVVSVSVVPLPASSVLLLSAVGAGMRCRKPRARGRVGA